MTSKSALLMCVAIRHALIRAIPERWMAYRVGHKAGLIKHLPLLLLLLLLPLLIKFLQSRRAALVHVMSGSIIQAAIARYGHRLHLACDDCCPPDRISPVLRILLQLALLHLIDLAEHVRTSYGWPFPDALIAGTKLSMSSMLRIFQAKLLMLWTLTGWARERLMAQPPGMPVGCG